MGMIVIPNGNREKRGLSGDLWGKQPYARAAFDPTYGHFFFDDFNPYLAENYTARQLSGASGTATSQTARHGELVLSAAAVTQWDGYQLQLGDGTGSYYAPSTSGVILVEGLFELGAALTQPAFFFGLCTVGTDANEDDSLQGTNMVGFYTDGDDLNIDFVVKNNSSSDAQASIGAFVAGEWIKLGIEIDKDLKVTPFINGVRMTGNAVTDTADIPDNTDWMVPTVSIANGTTDETTTLRLDWIAAYQSDGEDKVGT